MDEVFDCAAPNYEVASREGEQSVNIIVQQKDPRAMRFTIDQEAD
jgi:hypothetical protein